MAEKSRGRSCSEPFNCIIVSQIIYQIVPYPQNFLPVKFFPSVIFKYLASSFKKYCEPMQGGTQLMPVQV